MRSSSTAAAATRGGTAAIDIDIEGDAYNDPATGPDGSMIGRAADSGLEVDGWTIMPFDFGGAGQNMADLTEQATDGLKYTVKNAYGYSDEEAYAHSALAAQSAMAGRDPQSTGARASTKSGKAAKSLVGYP